jgi:2-furoate---CoA ligase
VTLVGLLERAVLRRPEAEAVVDGPRRLDYAGLGRRTAELGAGFRRLGVDHGDRVLIALRNRLEHVLTYWALQRLGAVPVPINFRLAPAEIRYLLTDSGAAVALCEPATAPAMVEAAAGSTTRLVHIGEAAPPARSTGKNCSGKNLSRHTLSGATVPGRNGWRQATRGGGAGEGPPLMGYPIRGGPSPAPPPRVAEHDLSLILYTSGTTGRPKGVPRTQRNHYAGAVAHVVQCGYTWGERTLGVMPLYHTMGIHALTSMVVVNGCFVCQPEWNPATALALITAERISALYLIPTLYYDLVHAPAFTGADVTSVTKLAFAGAPMLGSLTEACVQAFRPAVFVNHYGSTEIYTFSTRPDVHEKAGCAGRPGLHTRLRVVQASTERRVSPDEVVAPGDKGEIIAALDSAEAFAGYWKRPDADARAVRDGWYFTGDMGYVDDAGELWVSGRVDDMIISGGENVHPVEVEEVLARHPGVRDVAVVGEPDERWGERVVAFVVPREAGLTAEALDAWCRSGGELAPFKRPRRVVFVPEIPKTASGKILRRLLRDSRYAERPT